MTFGELDLIMTFHDAQNDFSIQSTVLYKNRVFENLHLMIFGDSDLIFTFLNILETLQMFISLFSLTLQTRWRVYPASV